MKKIVLYCLSCLLLSACIREDRDDCGIEVRFLVTLEHSTERYDAEIANNVYFQIFRNDVLIKTDVIPYETIKGGKEVVITDFNPGTYKVVAWAVPANDPDVPDIPEALIGDSYHEISLDLSRMPNNTAYYNPIGEIYLGEENVILKKDESSFHEVSLSPVIAKVYFTVYRADLLMEPTKADDQPVWTELNGVNSYMMLDRSCGGPDITIYKNMSYTSSNQTLFSGMMGILTSPDDEYLNVTLYKQGYKICLVETNERAEPGDEIWIEATLGEDVVVYVNGWRVRNARVTYF